MNANTRLGAEGLVGTDSHADIHKTELDPVCPGSEKPPPPQAHCCFPFHTSPGLLCKSRNTGTSWWGGIVKGLFLP